MGSTSTQPPAGGKRGLTAAILAIVAAVVSVEGGYVDHPNDPGGKTNHGITERVARDNGYRGNMRSLTKDQAKDIYAKQYVQRPGFAAIVAASPALGEEVVDSGVNAGPKRPSCWFQESLNHLNERGRAYPDIAEDCDVGPATMRAYAKLERRRGRVLACELVLKLMDAKQAAHYMRLAGRNSKFESFMPGWTRTRLGNVPLSHCTHRVEGA